MHRMSGVIILTLLVHLFTGCDYRDGWEDVGMEIEAAGVVSVSDDRPAEVVIGAVGVNMNTCVDPNAKVYATREGNNIYLTATMERPSGPVGCFQAETDVYGEVTMKNFKVGEYKILADISSELGRFRIEENAAYVDIEPIINGFIVYPMRPDEDTSYYVEASIGIEEAHEIVCDLIPRTTLWTVRSGDLNFDIRRIVPKNAGSSCGIISLGQPNDIGYTSWTHNTEIYLGVFSAGSHSVVIDGMNYLFDIPLQVDWGSIERIMIPPKTDAATPRTDARSLH
ncbi:MAG: hypothetical protein OYL97_11350 [Candidatus Poribacteria bacterium]|nr:hypothetical protein [Candidatus Poribacteria bacterium]